MSETACIIEAEWNVLVRNRIKRQSAESVLLNRANPNGSDLSISAAFLLQNIQYAHCVPQMLKLSTSSNSDNTLPLLTPSPPPETFSFITLSLEI